MPMQIVLSKDSEVPLKQQITEQIVFLITTGQLLPGTELPSVRALGRQSKVHHNTISEAYQELVRRGWLTRRPGSRLVVGTGAAAAPGKPHDLDALLNETIERARAMGFPLQALRLRVRERLLAEPADHLLVIEREPGLREIVRREIEDGLGWPTQGCSPDELAREPGLAIGAQGLVARHGLERMNALVASDRPCLGIVYSLAAEHVQRIQQLQQPSVVSLVSVSPGVLRTARSLFAPAIGKRHVLQEILVADQGPVALAGNDLAESDLAGSDLVFCDTLTIGRIHARGKVHYRLIATACLAELDQLLNHA